jgi:N-acyl-L-homoserine lactone synthetase
MLTRARGRSAGRYRARLAASQDDVCAAQRLRWRAFRADAATPEGRDADDFDAECQHMLVEDTRDGTLVCCFRLMHLPSGAQIGRSYSAQFYELSALEAFDAPMVEMGRFCIAPGRSDPDILRVAWAAMTEFVDSAGVQMLFGCSSFHGTEAQEYPRRLRASQGAAPCAAALAATGQGAVGLPLRQALARQARPQARHGRDAAASQDLPVDGWMGVRSRGDRPRPRHAARLHGAGDLGGSGGTRAHPAAAERGVIPARGRVAMDATSATC